MGNITFNTMLKLKSVGFAYPDYEHYLNKGMLYFYRDDEYLIGGNSLAGFSENDQLASQQGCWLPDDSQLLKWLQETEFDVLIQWNSAERYFHIWATDCQNSVKYTAGGIILVDALAKLIYKICKSARRPYIPHESLKLEIESNTL